MLQNLRSGSRDTCAATDNGQNLAWPNLCICLLTSKFETRLSSLGHVYFVEWAANLFDFLRCPYCFFMLLVLLFFQFVFDSRSKLSGRQLGAPSAVSAQASSRKRRSESSPRSNGEVQLARTAQALEWRPASSAAQSFIEGGAWIPLPLRMPRVWPGPEFSDAPTALAPLPRRFPPRGPPSILQRILQLV